MSESTTKDSTTPTRPAPGPAETSRLPHFPVSLFASVMGIGGLSLAWRRASIVFGVPAWAGQLLFWAALAVFLVVATAYAGKWLRHTDAARAELRHPVRMAFVPTVTIALLVLATAGQDPVRGPAVVAWWVAAVGHLVLTVITLSSWFNRRDILPGSITPAWFIPVVGNVVTPLAAPHIGNMDLAWFAFGIGMTFWVALLPLLIQRVLTHDQPLPLKLVPTLAIFVAPPAVAMLSWQSLTGRIDDPLSRVLFAATVGFAVLVAAQYRLLLSVPFAMPYWAYTFPAAAATVAAIAVAGDRQAPVYTSFAWALLILSTILVLAVAALTLRAAARHQICVPE